VAGAATWYPDSNSLQFPKPGTLVDLMEELKFPFADIRHWLQRTDSAYPGREIAAVGNMLAIAASWAATALAAGTS